MTFNPGISKSTGCMQSKDKDSSFNFGDSKTCNFPFEPGPSCPSNAQYQLVYNEMANKPNEVDCDRQDTLVQSLVDDSLWETKLDRRFVMAIHTNDAGEAQLDWIDPANNLPLLNVNGCTFTAFEGFDGDEATQHMDTQYAPNIDGVLYTLTNCSVNIYIRNDRNQNSRIPFGSGVSASGGDTVLMTPSNAGKNASIRINTSQARAGAVADSTGEYVGTKLIDADHDYYKNKVKIIDESDAGMSLSAFDIYLIAFNASNSAQFHTAFQVSKAFMGAGYTQTDANNEFTAFNDVYMTAYGKQVA